LYILFDDDFVVQARQLGSLFRLLKIFFLGNSAKIHELVQLRHEIAQKIHTLVCFVQVSGHLQK
jgi:hypothetical protein